MLLLLKPLQPRATWSAEICMEGALLTAIHISNNPVPCKGYYTYGQAKAVSTHSFMGGHITMMLKFNLNICQSGRDYSKRALTKIRAIIDLKFTKKLVWLSKMIWKAEGFDDSHK